LNNRFPISLGFNIDFDEWLFTSCKHIAFKDDNITAIEKLMDIKGINNWDEIILEYREVRKNATGPRAKP